jgi:nucleoside-diphosphate-sugar epimerase
VQANILAARNIDAGGRIYNVGTGHSIEIRKLWDMIAALAQSTNLPEFAAPRSGDIVHSCSDINKARTQLGFEPEISMRAGVQLTFDWYRNKK